MLYNDCKKTWLLSVSQLWLLQREEKKINKLCNRTVLITGKTNVNNILRDRIENGRWVPCRVLGRTTGTWPAVKSVGVVFRNETWKGRGIGLLTSWTDIQEDDGCRCDSVHWKRVYMHTIHTQTLAQKKLENSVLQVAAATIGQWVTR